MPGNTTVLKIAIEVDDKGSVKVKQFGQAVERAGDKGEKGFKRTGKSLEIMNKRLEKSHGWITKVGGSMLAYFGGRKVLSWMEEWVQLSGKQEQATAGMEQAMRSMGRYTPELYNELINTAKGLQEVTTFGDEATIQGQKFLLTYKDISDDMLPRASKAMLDLAALMGGDTTQAANMLGKASMGMTGELRRVGITVSRTAYESKGFLGVLEEIEKQVRGQAEAMAETGYGGVQQLGNLSGDAEEKLGDVILRIGELTGASEKLKDFLIKVNEQLENTDEIAGDLKEKIDSIIASAKAAYKIVQWDWAGAFKIMREEIEKTEDGPFWRGEVNKEVREVAEETDKAAEAAARLAGAWADVHDTAEEFVNYIRGDATDAMIDRIDELADAFEGSYDEVMANYLEKDAEKNEKIIEDNEHMLERMHDSTSDFIFDIVDEQIKSWRGLFDRVYDWFKRLLADMLAQVMLKPIVVPIVASVTGGIGGLFGGGGAGGTGNILSTIGGVSSLTGFGGGDLLGALGLGGLMTTPLWGGAGASLTGAQMGAIYAGSGAVPTGVAVGPTLGTLAGVGFLGSLGYSTLGDWLGLPQSKYSGLTSGLGAAAGFALGGPVGAIIGTLLAGIGGGLIKHGEPGMDLRHIWPTFGSEWIPGQGLSLSDYVSEEHWSGGSESAHNQITNAVRDAGNIIITSFNEYMLGLMEEMGGEYADTIEGMLMSADFGGFLEENWDIAARNFYISDAEEWTERQLTLFAEKLDKTVQEIIDTIVPQYVGDQIIGSDFYNALGAGRQEAISAYLGGGYSAEEYLTMLQTFQQGAAAFESIVFQMEAAAGVLSDLEIAQYQVNMQFDSWIATLIALGVSEGEVAKAEELRIKALDKLAEQYDKTAILANTFGDIEFQILSMTGALSDLEIAQHRVNEKYDQWIETLTRMEATEEMLAWVESQRAIALAQLVDADNESVNALSGVSNALSDWRSSMEAQMAEIDSVRAQYLQLITGPGNPADVYERLAIMESQLAPIGSALTQKDLALYMDYLTLAQQAYQRPSKEYQGIYGTVTSAYETWLSNAEGGLWWNNQGGKSYSVGEQNFYINIPLTINEAKDPEEAGKKFDAHITKFFQGRGRGMIKDAAKPAQWH